MEGVATPAAFWVRLASQRAIRVAHSGDSPAARNGCITETGAPAGSTDSRPGEEVG